MPENQNMQKTSDNEAMLQEIVQNTEMGKNTLDQLVPMAEDEQFKAELLRQRRGVVCLYAPGVLAAEKDKVIAKAVHFDEFHPSISRFFPFPPLYQKAGALPRRGAQKIFSGR